MKKCMEPRKLLRHQTWIGRILCMYVNPSTLLAERLGKAHNGPMFDLVTPGSWNWSCSRTPDSAGRLSGMSFPSRASSECEPGVLLQIAGLHRESQLRRRTSHFP